MANYKPPSDPPEGRQRKPMSRITTMARQGVTSFLDGVDHRGVVARRFRDLVAEITSDQGGPDELSEATKQIIRRIATLSVWCESEEAKMAEGSYIDIALFQTTANSLRRLCESIGLERKAKPIPSLSEYIARTYPRGGDNED